MEQVTKQAVGRITVATRGRRMENVTSEIEAWLREEGAREGLVTVFIRHTSASLTIQENADPDVQADLLDAFDRLAPERAGYRHDAEGPDDMPSHIKAVLSDTSLSVPVVDGRMELGTWQGIYVIEHRAHSHQRTLSLCFQGR